MNIIPARIILIDTIIKEEYKRRISVKNKDYLKVKMSTWNSILDVQRDLTKVTNSIADVDIDDSYIVIGNERPRPRIEDEFFDDDPRFEGADLNYDSKLTPDLDGIKKLLRMCSEHEEMEERQRGIEAISGNETPYVISKLNPLTAPFEPKPSAAVADRLAKEQEIRKKIDQASLDNSRKGRTQKNVAIASLLKLHSKSTSGPHAPPRPETSEDVREQDPAPQTEDESGKDSIQNVNSWVNQNPSPQGEDETVKESIQKVNSWFNAADHRTDASPTPSQSKSSPVPVEQSMFKKKQATKSTTSSQTSNVKKQPVSTVVQSKVYKPSNYAENLRSKYIENNKPKKQPNENVWEKLERELKEKDEKIMMERRNAELQSRSSTGNSSS